MGRFCASRTLPRSSWALRTTTFTRTLTASPSAAIVLKQAPAAAIEEVKKKLEEIQESSFPPGMKIRGQLRRFLLFWMPRSNRCCTRCWKPSCWSQSWCTCSSGIFVPLLIPTLAVPVSLIGAFFFMQLLGLSINLITLFAWCWQSASWWMTRSWWSKRCMPRWQKSIFHPTWPRGRTGRRPGTASQAPVAWSRSRSA